MKKFFMYLPLATLLFAAACGDNDDDDVIAEPYVIEIPEITDELHQNRMNLINSTRSMMIEANSSYSSMVDSIHCTRLTLKVRLPAVPAEKYLVDVKRAFPNNYYSISNPSARIGFIEFYACNYDGYTMSIGLSQIFDGDTHSGRVEYYYLDRDVSINGPTLSSEDEYKTAGLMKFDNVTLKKGWNRVAIRRVDEPRQQYIVSLDIPADTYWKTF